MDSPTVRTRADFARYLNEVSSAADPSRDAGVAAMVESLTDCVLDSYTDPPEPPHDWTMLADLLEAARAAAR